MIKCLNMGSGNVALKQKYPKYKAKNNAKSDSLGTLLKVTKSLEKERKQHNHTCCDLLLDHTNSGWCPLLGISLDLSDHRSGQNGVSWAAEQLVHWCTNRQVVDRAEHCPLFHGQHMMWEALEPRRSRSTVVHNSSHRPKSLPICQSWQNAQSWESYMWLENWQWVGRINNRYWLRSFQRCRK